MNCKPGDLAILIHASVKDNIGMIVSVGESAGCREGYSACWYIKASPKKVTIGNAVRAFKPDEALWCPDEWLRPVSGLPVTDDIIDEVTV